jgi:hypothetical protein
MRILFLALVLFLSLGLKGQNSTAYSDQDLRNYIETGKAMAAYRVIMAAKVDSVQGNLNITKEAFDAALQGLKSNGNWDSYRSTIDTDFAMRFEALMFYRQSVRGKMKLNLLKEIEPFNWDEDYYQHLELSLQSDPELQARLIALSKS